MEQQIIIRKEQSIQTDIEYTKRSFSQFDKEKNYLHINNGDFNLYIEMNEFQIEDMLRDIQKQIKKVKYKH